MNKRKCNQKKQIKPSPLFFTDKPQPPYFPATCFLFPSISFILIFIFIFIVFFPIILKKVWPALRTTSSWSHLPASCFRTRLPPSLQPLLKPIMARTHAGNGSGAMRCTSSELGRCKMILK
uniref:Transmembrane protein n=1 Tax=Opuntia streptacantha TaxID=393608 RepID=A0A7C8YWZ4_OPUST